MRKPELNPHTRTLNWEPQREQLAVSVDVTGLWDENYYLEEEGGDLIEEVADMADVHVWAKEGDDATDAERLHCVAPWLPSQMEHLWTRDAHLGGCLQEPCKL